MIVWKNIHLCIKPQRLWLFSHTSTTHCIIPYIFTAKKSLFFHKPLYKIIIHKHSVWRCWEHRQMINPVGIHGFTVIQVLYYDEKSSYHSHCPGSVMCLPLHVAIQDYMKSINKMRGLCFSPSRTEQTGGSGRKCLWTACKDVGKFPQSHKGESPRGLEWYKVLAG